MRLLSAALLLLVLAGVLASALTRPVRGYPRDQPMTISADSIGGPMSGAPVEVWRPAGATGPVPAVILMAGCGGNSDGERDWAQRLAEWGYAGIILDSYRPRHVKAICGRSRVDSALRAQDLLNTAEFLRTQPGIAGDRIAAIGYSQGAGASLIAVVADPKRPTPLAALVAYYTSCRLPPGTRLAVDTLALVGTADTLVSSARCADLTIADGRGDRPVPIKFYEGANHNFDRHGTDAARRSIADVKAFLDAHLKAE